MIDIKNEKVKLVLTIGVVVIALLIIFNPFSAYKQVWTPISYQVTCGDQTGVVDYNPTGMNLTNKNDKTTCTVKEKDVKVMAYVYTKTRK